MGLTGERVVIRMLWFTVRMGIVLFLVVFLVWLFGGISYENAEMILIKGGLPPSIIWLNNARFVWKSDRHAFEIAEVRKTQYRLNLLILYTSYIAWIGVCLLLSVHLISPIEINSVVNKLMHLSSGGVYVISQEIVLSKIPYKTPV